MVVRRETKFDDHSIIILLNYYLKLNMPFSSVILKSRSVSPTSIYTTRRMARYQKHNLTFCDLENNIIANHLSHDPIFYIFKDIVQKWKLHNLTLRPWNVGQTVVYLPSLVFIPIPYWERRPKQWFSTLNFQPWIWTVALAYPAASSRWNIFRSPVSPGN